MKIFEDDEKYTDQFVKDLKLLIRHRDTISGIYQIFHKSNDYSDIFSKIYKQLEKSLGISKRDLLDMCKAVAAIMSQKVKKQITDDDVETDLRTLKFLENEIKIFMKIFKYLTVKNRIKTFENLEIISDELSTLTPSILQLDATYSEKIILNQKEQVIKKLPVVELHIEIDRYGTKKRTILNMSLEKLDAVIQRLIEISEETKTVFLENKK